MQKEKPQFPLSPPVVWPQEGLDERREPPSSTTSPFSDPRSIFGLIHAPDESNVYALQSLAFRKPELRCRLIICVSAACATQKSDLELLHQMMSESKDRLVFRILVLGSGERTPVNCICITTSDSEEHFISVGSQNPFGGIDWKARGGNLLWKSDPVLFESLRRWFDLRWQEADVLNQVTIQIPALVPAKGTPEAAELWQAYVGSFTTKLDPSGNGNAAALKQEASVTEELGIEKLDDLAERMSRIFELGDQVTIDKQTRIPPLDAPIKPEWFGVESLRHVGAVQRRVEYRVSVIDEKTLRDLNNKRRSTRTVLERLSLPLSDGVRWMPKKVFPLFEAEMQRVNADAQKAFKDAVGDKADLLVETQKKRLRNDANQMYRDFHPDDDLPDEVFDKIIADLKSRLGKAGREVLLPQISRLQIGFKATKNSQWESAWGIALTLLLSAAEFPRKALTDAFFLRGLRIKTDDLLDAMNVCSDHIIEKRKSSRVDQIAQDELGLIKDIQQLEIDAKTKCKAVLCILAGEGPEGVTKALKEQEVTAAPSS